MNPERIFSCAVKVSRRYQQGPPTQIGNHSRLTISFVYDHGPILIVHDAQHKELLRMMLASTDVIQYTVISRLTHEISRHEDTKITLDFYEEDEDDVNAFMDIVEPVLREMRKFGSYAEVKDSSSSGSEDGGEYVGAAAAPAMGVISCMRPTQIVTYWDCAHCTFASSDEHKICGECNKPREVNLNLEWQCHCHRVYSNAIVNCGRCGMWRCHKCTLLNESSSSHQCSLCGTERRR